MQKAKSDKERFAVAMYGLAEEFGGTLTENNLLLKWESLKKHDINDVILAISFLMENRTITFPQVPTTQEIIKAIEVIQNPQLAIGSECMAEIQANTVIAFLHQNGSDAIPAFEDPLTQLLMTKVWPYAGWGRSLVETQKAWWRKEFIKTYTVYSETKRQCLRLDIAHPFQQIARTAVKQISHMTQCE